MSGWREYKIFDIADVIGGGILKTAIKKYCNGNIPRLSAFDTITRNTFVETIILLPSPKEKKAIGEVLHSIDDKIDLFHRQNKTLEALAQTLFRQWFIEEAKNEWKITTFGSLENAVIGKTPSTKNAEFWGNEISFIIPTDFKYYGKHSTFFNRSFSTVGMKKVNKSVPLFIEYIYQYLKYSYPMFRVTAMRDTLLPMLMNGETRVKI